MKARLRRALFLFSFLLLGPSAPRAGGPLDTLSLGNTDYEKVKAWAERGLLEDENPGPLLRGEPVTRYEMAFYIDRVKPRIQAPSEHPGIKTPFIRVEERDVQDLNALISAYRAELDLILGRYTHLRQRRQKLRARVDNLEKTMKEAEEDILEASLKDKVIRVSGDVDVNSGYNKTEGGIFRRNADGSEVEVANIVPSNNTSFGTRFALHFSNDRAGKLDWAVDHALALDRDNNSRWNANSFGTSFFTTPGNMTYNTDFETDAYDLNLSLGKVLSTRASPFTFQPYRNVSTDWTLGRNVRDGEWADRQIHGALFEFQRLPWELRSKFGAGRLGLGGDTDYYNSGGYLEKSIKKHLFRFNWGWLGDMDTRANGTKLKDLAVSFQDTARVDAQFKLTAEMGVGILNTGYNFNSFDWEEQALSGAWTVGSDFPDARRHTAKAGHALFLSADRRLDIFDYSIPFTVEYYEISPTFPGNGRGFLDEGLGMVAESLEGAGNRLGVKKIITTPKLTLDNNAEGFPTWDTTMSGLDGFSNNRRAIKFAGKFKQLLSGILDVIYKIETEIDPNPSFYSIHDGQAYYTGGGVPGEKLNVVPGASPQYHRTLAMPREWLALVADENSFCTTQATALVDVADPEFGQAPPGRYFFNMLRAEYTTGLNKFPLFKDFMRTKRTFVRFIWQNNTVDRDSRIRFDDWALARSTFMKVESMAAISGRVTLFAGWAKTLIESRWATYMSDLALVGGCSDGSLNGAGIGLSAFSPSRISIKTEAFQTGISWDAPGGIATRFGLGWVTGDGYSPTAHIHTLSIKSNASASIGF